MPGRRPRRVASGATGCSTLQKMFIVAGWVVTAIAAAAISGMIRRDD
ncbi:MAG: hypothetical protein U5N27_00565 [Rhizobium sp.]|nr:hypothetical protein [Rhizobium sp.]